jgi:all-trans-retinol dehydrogenase (NAD+)
MKNVTGKKILITGAGSGIGRLMAKSLSLKGAQVLCVDINLAAAEETVREIKQSGGKAFAFYADVSSTESLVNLKKEVATIVGKVDGLINNAGVVFGGEFEKLNLDKHLLTYKINIEGLVTITHLFFEDLRESSDAHIVNIASASGLIGLPYGTTYASSKWAVIGFSDSLRLELLERNIYHIHVTTVCPSYISTGMFHGVKAPFLIPWLKPEVIVQKIISGMENNSSFVREPFIVKTVDLLKGILPKKAFDLVAKIIGVSTSMTHWKGRN